MDLSRRVFLQKLGLLGASLAAPSLSWAAQTAAGSTEPGAETIRRAAPVARQGEAGVHFVHHGPGLGRRLAVTFDDGPTPGVTEKVLAALRERQLSATFFMIGQRVAAAPSLARRVREEGHEIGNHSYTHPQLGRLLAQQVQEQLQRTQVTIEQATGFRPSWMRPPYGSFRPAQASIAAQESLGVVFWSVDTRDWARPGTERILETVLTQSRPGSIVLMHDLHLQTAEVVGRVLDGLLERGFEFATISGFLGSPRNA
ncbi:Peptidoglycan-N-acetylmuramic acid deacetylase PdaC [Methylacidimicrobium cyclopophantes]|uniref:Peptidoglycan-N-acetylmuramic acid deacetylase PdaC n=1 Tax=Methylacidimicrobium cyclopophantes TaxID=1041766 RepID=A0A5E6MAE9_9BACT|nr:polysaccharide deacetylase family protein [Methylacidimicrobium cyclopophantes]VVM06522.1 Peptidoglycan-N-acetylmuramic acid deacetylase PdaC [Methylacidimicrobium cyclopophantes]